MERQLEHEVTFLEMKSIAAYCLKEHQPSAENTTRYSSIRNVVYNDQHLAFKQAIYLNQPEIKDRVHNLNTFHENIRKYLRTKREVYLERIWSYCFKTLFQKKAMLQTYVTEEEYNTIQEHLKIIPHCF